MTTWSLLTLTEPKQNKNSISFMTEASTSHILAESWPRFSSFLARSLSLSWLLRKRKHFFWAQKLKVMLFWRAWNSKAQKLEDTPRWGCPKHCGPADSHNFQQVPADLLHFFPEKKPNTEDSRNCPTIPASGALKEPQLLENTQPQKINCWKDGVTRMSRSCKVHHRKSRTCLKSSYM